MEYGRKVDAIHTQNLICKLRIDQNLYIYDECSTKGQSTIARNFLDLAPSIEFVGWHSLPIQVEAPVA